MQIERTGVPTDSGAGGEALQSSLDQALFASEKLIESNKVTSVCGARAIHALAPQLNWFEVPQAEVGPSQLASRT